MKYSDRPITRPREDVLGRSPFALALARSIDQLTIAKDGFVIAVTGPWGSGKSSVIEMTLRHLTHLEIERATADSNGAFYTLDAIETLAEAYDLAKDELAKYVNDNLELSMARVNHLQTLFNRWLDSPEEGKKAYTYWKLLRTIEHEPRIIQIRFSPWLIAGRAQLANALLAELGRAIGTKLGPDIKDAFDGLLKRLAELAPLAFAGIDAATGTNISSLATAGTNWSGKFLSKSTSTLDDLREHLRALLRGLTQQRVLVIIDDLDRLESSEATEMVALIKNLGDLPNVIYLLSYDHDNLVRLLKSRTMLSGDEFLRKFNIPYIYHPPLITHLQEFLTPTSLRS